MTKEELLKWYHEEEADLEEKAEDAFFLVNNLRVIAQASNTGDNPFVETCRGLHKMADRICAAFSVSLDYLKKAVAFLEDESEEVEAQ